MYSRRLEQRIYNPYHQFTTAFKKNKNFYVFQKKIYICTINTKQKAMKRTLIISLLVAAMGMIMLSGCQKKSSCEGCEGGISGYLQVLDKPYKTDSHFFKENVKITAHFYQNKNLEGHCYCITGKVPHNISSDEFISVKIQQVYPDPESVELHVNLIPIYKLNCFCNWNE